MTTTLDDCLIARLGARAKTADDGPAFVFLPRAGRPIELSWRGLDARVRRLAASLVATGVEPGQVVFVLSASPYEQALGFLGAMAAGAHPSILSFPSVKQSRDRFYETLRPIVHATDARWIVSSSELTETAALANLRAGVVELPSSEALDRRDDPASLPAPARAFLQFSSGTTGLRKCVRITSEMLASQAATYAEALALTPHDRVASWLPLYHDMGLIAAFLLPVFHGNMAVHLSPFDWLKEPAFFLRAISHYRATLAWMPNFAYRLTADQVSDEELAGLDLGSLRALVNCSEPVRASAHDAFVARFARAGVRPEQLQACYAMAETTFAATQTPPGRPARVDRVDGEAFAARHRALPITGEGEPAKIATFVSSGRPIATTEVRIDGAGEEREVGEILLRSASLYAGYGADASGRDAFTADGFYRTGDLGYLADGELFVTGRAKELVIHRGSNVYPADVEEILGTIDGLRPGRAVVFGVDDEAQETEEIVAMAEAADASDERELARRIREAVWAALSVALADIHFCPAGTLKKSTSGKLSRAANRALYFERRGAASPRANARPRPALAAAYVAPRDLWERQIAWLWEEVLGVHPVGIHDNVFLELSADSLSTTRVAGEIRKRWGREIQPTALLGADTVARQADLLRGGDPPAEPLVTLQRRGRGTSLFVVHAAGGWAFPYVTLARELGADRPLHAFQAPELFRGDVAALSVPAMADTYLRALRKVQPRGPYLLSGWSFGGLVAFEMANRLRAAGETVARLVLFDTAPPVPRGKQLTNRALQAAFGVLFRASLKAPWLQDRVRMLRHLRAMAPLWRFFAGAHLSPEGASIAPLLEFAFRERCDRARLAASSEDALWDYLVELANERPTPEDQLLLIPGVDGAAARRALAVSKKLETLNASYATSFVYDGPIDVFAVRGNPGLAPWRMRTTGELRLHWFDIQRRLINPHFDMMEAENVRLFAPALRRLLADADASGAESPRAGAPSLELP